MGVATTSTSIPSNVDSSESLLDHEAMPTHSRSKRNNAEPAEQLCLDHARAICPLHDEMMPTYRTWHQRADGTEYLFAPYRDRVANQYFALSSHDDIETLVTTLERNCRRVRSSMRSVEYETDLDGVRDGGFRIEVIRPVQGVPPPWVTPDPTGTS
jgi:hypothetical protein